MSGNCIILQKAYSGIVGFSLEVAIESSGWEQGLGAYTCFLKELALPYSIVMENIYNQIDIKNNISYQKRNKEKSESIHRFMQY